MPQFDTFIFSSSLFYFFICFFVLLSTINTRFLPRLAAILKLRSKLISKSSSLEQTKGPSFDHLSIFSYNLTIQ